MQPVNYRHLRIAILGLLLFMSAAPSFAQARYLVGTWNIMGTLIVESGDPRDHTRPKPGYQKPDRWAIAAHGNGLSLTSPAGTIYGSPTPSGAHFEGRYPIPLGGNLQGFLQVKIDVMLSTPNTIKATEELLYFMPNGLGVMQIVPAAREAWTAFGQRM